MTLIFHLLNAPAFHLLNAPASNVHNRRMSIKKQCRTFNWMAVVICAISVTICEILAVEIDMTLTVTIGQDQIKSNVNMPIDSTCRMIYLMEIVISLCYLLSFMRCFHLKCRNFP